MALPVLLALFVAALACPEARAQSGGMFTQTTSNGGDNRPLGSGEMYSTIGEPVASDSINTVDDGATWTGFWQVTPIGQVAGVREWAGSGAAAGTGITAALPDPFTDELELRVSLATAAEVELIVYDVFGRRAGKLVTGRREAGTLALRWRPEGLPVGSYLLQLVVNGETADARLVHYYR